MEIKKINSSLTMMHLNLKIKDAKRRVSIFIYRKNRCKSKTFFVNFKVLSTFFLTEN